MNESDTQKAVERNLMERGIPFVTKKDLNWLERIPDLMYIDEETLVALEVKGDSDSNIDRGYIQAYEYRKCADKTYLVIPESNEKSISKEALISLGVSLILVGNKRLEVVIPSEISSTDDILKQKIIEIIADSKKGKKKAQSSHSISARTYIEKKIEDQQRFTIEEVFHSCGTSSSLIQGIIREHQLRGQIGCVGRTLNIAEGSLRDRLGEKWYGPHNIRYDAKPLFFPFESLVQCCVSIVSKKNNAVAVEEVYSAVCEIAPGIFSLDDVRRALGYAVKKGWLHSKMGRLSNGRPGSFFSLPEKQTLLNDVDPEKQIIKCLKENGPMSLPEIADCIGYSVQGTQFVSEKLLSKGLVIIQGIRSGSTVYIPKEKYNSTIASFLSRYKEQILKTIGENWKSTGDVYSKMLLFDDNYRYRSFQTNIVHLEKNGYLDSKNVGREKAVRISEKGKRYLFFLNSFLEE